MNLMGKKNKKKLMYSVITYDDRKRSLLSHETKRLEHRVEMTYIRIA